MASMYDYQKFGTGATRTVSDSKYDYEGFLSPLVIERFGEYMHLHRKQPDGNMRASDNWTLGIPRANYVKSLWRHFLDLLLVHRGYNEKAVEPNLEEILCAMLFNVQGLLHEVLLERDTGKETRSEQTVQTTQ